ncbi:phosphatase PAP2 family protein [Streptomyces sp. NPDC001941]|uniref:phosphatase PAP2 family protein n=1 Tax=Streptomyces sp. NPDC001941 TaxID=3154659 RepID=UPI00331911B0
MSDRPGTTRRYGWWILLPAVALLALTIALSAGALAPLPGDSALLRTVLAHRTAADVPAFRMVTATGTGAIPYLVTLGAGALVLANHPFLTARWPSGTRIAVAASGCVAWLALGQAVRFGLMTVLARPRPPAEDWLTRASRYAYPSGHATTAAMAAGIVVVALLLRRPRGHRYGIASAVCWAALVGVSRVRLGVHWPSDVLAGWLLATAWSALGALCAAHWLYATDRSGHDAAPGPADRAPR